MVVINADGFVETSKAVQLSEWDGAPLTHITDMIPSIEKELGGGDITYYLYTGLDYDDCPELRLFGRRKATEKELEKVQEEKLLRLKQQIKQAAESKKYWENSLAKLEEELAGMEKTGNA